MSTFLSEATKGVPQLLEYGGYAIAGLILLIGFYFYRRNIILSQVVFSLDRFEKEDGKTHLRFRTPLTMSLDDLAANDRFFKWHIWWASLRTSVDDPFLRLDRRKMRRLHGAIQNAMSELCSEGTFLKEAATDPSSGVDPDRILTRKYYAAVTHEKYGNMPSHKIRVIIVSEDRFFGISLFEEEERDSIVVEEKHHRDRLDTEHMMRQEVKRIMAELGDRELELGECAVMQFEMNFPKP